MRHQNLGKYVRDIEFELANTHRKFITFHFRFLEQMPHELNGSFSDVAQMGYPSPLGPQDLSIRPSQDGFQM